MAEPTPLQQVALGEDPDEREDPSIVPVPGALEEVVGRQPATLRTKSRRTDPMTTSRALEKLDEAKTRLTDRLAAAEEDRTGEWLALAQGMLAPTKTGGFGESLGAAAGLVREARSERRKNLTEIEQSLLDAEVKQQTLALQARPRLGRSETVYHPDDVAEFPDNPENWRQIEKQTIVHSDGEVEHIFTASEDGEILQVVSRDNPITVRETEDAKVAGRKAQERIQHDIDQGLVATLAINRLRRARELFEVYTTSGLKDDLGAIGNYLGIEIADNATLPLIRNLIGKEILSQLRELTGTKTDFEYKKIESLNASTAKGQEANLKIIDEMIGRYDRMINIGERAALAAAKNEDEDLSVTRYREYRAGEEERKKLMAQRGAVERRTPPTSANDDLVELWGTKDEGFNNFLKERYESRYGWPPTDPEVLSKLRAKGYKD